MQWTTEDWDPALRFWNLPFDQHLGEWLRAADRTRPATLAAMEFAEHYLHWHPEKINFEQLGWLEAEDLAWMPDREGFARIRSELEQLRIYMEDDRARYLLESDVQADGLPAFMIHFIGAHLGRYPWTLELINCGLSIGNVAYMSYKSHFRRVRPSVLRPA
jgi:hypothetical protein